MIIKREKDLIEPYLTDASNYQGEASELIFPENAEELSSVLADCYESGTSATISGGRTGLVGACVPEGGVVVSLEKMNEIIEINEKEKYAILQPGVVISDFVEELNQRKLFYPPYPTETASLIGGNVGANSSGALTFKYGATRDYVQSLDLVLANGDRIHLDRGEVKESNGALKLKTESGKFYQVEIKDVEMPSSSKNAAGFYMKKGLDAIDLFIGSEGTLAAISRVKVSLLKAPEKLISGLAFFEDYDSTLEFVEKLREKSKANNAKDYRGVKDIASRVIEFFDENSLSILKENYSQVPKEAKAAIWFEQEYVEENEDAILNEWYKLISEKTQLADSTIIAMNDNDRADLAEMRHLVPTTVQERIAHRNLKKEGTDTAVPDKNFRDYFNFTTTEIKKLGLEYYIWGHIGNSHLHANLLAGDKEGIRKIYDFYELCVKEALKYKGTVSAEHGIGKLKKKYLKMMYDKEVIDAFKRAKLSLDGKNILGRGNLF